MKVIIIISFYLLLTYSVQVVSASEPFIQSAIEHKDRTATDVQSDSFRKPAEILTFFKVQAQTTVLDVLAGSGYYSEILSHAVGEQGKVIIHNDKHFLKYYGDPLSDRLGDTNRLVNAERLDISLNDLQLEENSVDTIFLILGFHDFYYIMDESEKIDVKKVLANFRKFLKPNGIVGIVDHDAKQGAPSTVGGNLHRIDSQIVINEMLKAGFELDGELTIFKKPMDIKAIKIWDVPREERSRFILRFRNKK